MAKKRAKKGIGTYYETLGIKVGIISKINL
jgi:hypothetical protein